MNNQALNPQKQPQSLGSKIDDLYEMREKKRELNREVKDLEEMMKVLELEILDELEDQGLAFSGGNLGRAAISEEEVPTVEDWDQVDEYINTNEANYLMERRMSARAWRELFQSGELVPGTKPYTKKSLSLTKAPAKRKK